MAEKSLIESVSSLESGVVARELCNLPAVIVPVTKLESLMKKLRDDKRFSFDLLLTHTAIDWVEKASFELVYTLFSMRLGHKLVVTTMIPREKPIAPTLCRVWPIAEWQEREVFDLFGVQYDEHPDLRRVFLEDDWNGYPLRKDYKDPDMLESPK